MKARLRPATPADAVLYFDWVNSPDGLAWKQATREPIAWPVHEAWFRRRLADAGTLMRVVLDDAGMSAGQVRLQRDTQGCYAVDVYVVPQARGRGLASAALRAVRDEICAAVPGAILVATVRHGNAPSAALFRSLGFRSAGRGADHDIYIWEGQER